MPTPKVAVNVRLDPELVEQVRQLAGKRGFTALVEQALRRHLLDPPVPAPALFDLDDEGLI